MTFTVLRPTLRRPLQAFYQRRWAQVHNVRLLATSRIQSDVFEKYRSKLEEKARLEGFVSLDAMRNAYAEKISALRRSEATPVPEPEPYDDMVPKAQRKPRAKPPSESYKDYPPPKEPKFVAPDRIKTLDKILDLEKIRSLSNDELNQIWRRRYASMPGSHACAIIPTNTYRTMEMVAMSNPMFILPVPHDAEGFTLHVLQWLVDRRTRTSTVLFAQLAEWHARREYAIPHTALTHYTDLADERGIVLMQGEITEGRGIHAHDLPWFVGNMQRFYGAWDVEGLTRETPEYRERAENRRKLLQQFTSGAADFDVDKLVEEVMNLG